MEIMDAPLSLLSFVLIILDLWIVVTVLARRFDAAHKRRIRNRLLAQTIEMPGELTLKSNLAIIGWAKDMGITVIYISDDKAIKSASLSERFLLVDVDDIVLIKTVRFSKMSDAILYKLTFL